MVNAVGGDGSDVAAKEAEIRGWKEKNVFEVVNVEDLPKDASILSVRWVVTQRADGSKKARMVARGLDSNAPTSSHIAVKMFLAISTGLDHKVAVADCKQAFLNAPMNREVYLYPPDEMKLKEGQVLRVLRAVYGLADAGTLWHEFLKTRMIELGWRQAISEPSLFIRLNPEAQSGPLFFLMI